jgi:hypothetical protein
MDNRSNSRANTCIEAATLEAVDLLDQELTLLGGISWIIVISLIAVASCRRWVIQISALSAVMLV